MNGANGPYDYMSRDELVEVITVKDAALTKREAEYQRLNSYMEMTQNELEVLQCMCLSNCDTTHFIISEGELQLIGVLTIPEIMIRYTIIELTMRDANEIISVEINM